MDSITGIITDIKLLTKRVNALEVNPVSHYFTDVYVEPVVPPGAPTTAVNAAAGNLNGAYYYRITYITANGETEAGTDSAVVSPVNQKVDLTDIDVSTDSRVTGRKIYRTVGGGAHYLMYYVATLSDNTTTTYLDNTADGGLGVAGPVINSTGGGLYRNTEVIGQNSLWFTAFGRNALITSKGYSNAAFGNNAMYSNTVGDHCTAVGINALYSHTTGQNNVAVGFNALYTNILGVANVAVGANTLELNVHDANTALGNYALNVNTSGEKNVAVGASALLASTTGSSNIAIGYAAGSNLTTGSSNIIIGDNIAASAVGVSNELNIGGIIKGDTSGTPKIGFLGTAAVALQTKAAHNNWANISDIVSVLLNYGLVDQL